MSGLLSEKKRAENAALGDAAYKKAQGFTKKTLTRWKPDWDQAGRFYRDAVKHYAMSGDDELLVKVCRESAVAHDELGQYLTSAQHLEQAAAVLVKDGSGSSAPTAAARRQAYGLYREASIAYRKQSNPDKTAQMLVKAAECIESVDANGLGLEALQEACSVYEEEQRGALSDGTFKKAIGYAIKNAVGSDYAAAIELFKRQNVVYKQHLATFENDLYKNFLCMVVLTIQSGDLRGAIQLLESFAGEERFATSDVHDAGLALVQALEEGDEEALPEVLKRSPFKYIMNQVAVIARKFKISSGTAKKKKSTKPAAAPAAVEEDVDENDFT